MDLSFYDADDSKVGNLLAGKTIAAVNRGEYEITFVFTDGSELECSGHTYDGCSLHVEYTEPGSANAR